jgi:hypothetical protein
MAIFQGDIKLLASKVMDDVPEGGGGPTGTVIQDGASNAFFRDIDELDQAGGVVNIVQAFLAVQTPNSDMYMGANIIVSEPPNDPNVSITLAKTTTFARRTDIANTIENYLIPAAEWAGFLLENHVIGQKQLQIFQRDTEAPPNVGETLVLVYNEGLPTERKQFVRATGTSSISRTYTVVGSNGRTHKATVVTVALSDALRYDFPGSAQNEFFSREPTKTRIRASSVADAAEYYGAVRTTAPIVIGAMGAQVNSVFTQLVPAAQTETPLVDYNAAGTSAAITPASNGTISYTTAQPLNASTVLSVGNAITPGTLRIAVSGGSTLSDSGGQVYDGAAVVGTVDYGRGTASFAGLATPYNGAKTVTFTPAAAPLRVSDTAQIAVTQESRAYNYIITVAPTPTAGSGLVSYRAQGRWYDLRDNGGGVLRGTDAAYGVGTINYATGTISITLGALPDVGSAVMFAWNTPVNYINRADMAAPNPSVRLQMDADIVPGSVSIAWDDGTPRTAIDNGAGAITGSATGTVNYKTGLIALTPTVLPAGGQEFEVTAAYGAANVVTHSSVNPPRSPDTTVTIDLGETNITPGTVRMSWPVALVQGSAYNRDGSIRTDYSIAGMCYGYDDGTGAIYPSPGDYRPTATTAAAIGTIDYAAGLVTFQPDGQVVAFGNQYMVWHMPTYASASS